jgi:hypothetical protein
MAVETGATDQQIEDAARKWSEWRNCNQLRYLAVVRGYAIDLVPPDHRIVALADLKLLAAYLSTACLSDMKNGHELINALIDGGS